MKTIGMIGGMSWESSKIYYQHINEMVRERLGGSHSAASILSSVDFEEIERHSFSDNWEVIGTIMAEHAKKLEAAGAAVIILCTNTIHLVSDAITQATSIPFLHIAQVTGAAIQERGLKKIALLGTKFTMENDFYTKKLEDDFGLEVLIPDAGDREILQSIIYDELVKGTFTEKSKNICLGIIEKMKGLGAEGAILGCTELPILIPDSEASIPTFDTTKIHAKKAVDFALS
ncbi:amino acid racemase [Muricauda sp. JGD-17]|uniref:Amino acid racemase n=1 Tax=Flagellimonas ochracea TaxID=2696472 RepID=A0A964TD97_9FLAO|nr:amino acid racemase [Allomuricauda ochracea]NAY91878.1 amino acid racemase [Allomuricauda ochracea]